MKNKFIFGFSGFFLVVLCTTAKGQDLAGMPPSNKTGSTSERISGSEPEVVAANQREKNVLRKFNRKFDKVTDSRWYESSFGFVVKFNSKGINYRVDLDKKGEWLSTIRNYDEMKLPEDVKRLIRESYNGYSVTFVRDIETPFTPLTFLVDLDGKKDIVQLRVSGDEMQEYKRIFKTTSESFTSNNRN